MIKEKNLKIFPAIVLSSKCIFPRSFHTFLYTKIKIINEDYICQQALKEIHFPQSSIKYATEISNDSKTITQFKFFTLVFKVLGNEGNEKMIQKN